MNKSSLTDGIVRGFGRYESIKNHKGIEIGRDPLPDLFEIKTRTGTIILSRADDGILDQIEDSDAVATFAALFDGAQVRKRTAAQTEAAPPPASVADPTGGETENPEVAPMPAGKRGKGAPT